MCTVPKEGCLVKESSSMPIAMSSPACTIFDPCALSVSKGTDFQLLSAAAAFLEIKGYKEECPQQDTNTEIINRNVYNKLSKLELSE